MRTKGGKKIKFAVVGLGHLAQTAVLPGFKHARNSEVVALVSQDPKKLAKLGHKYKIDRLYSYKQYEKCLSQDVDAVYIVLPNHLHRDFTVRALEAGVHVLCEKPMAVTADDCEIMIDAARKNDRKLMIAYRLHFEKGNLEATNIAKRGKLGELRFFSSEFSQQVVGDNVRVTEPLNRGGGPVYDMGIYCINAARYLFRAEPVAVTAISAGKGRPRFRKVEEMTSVTMRFPGDRLATFTASFGAADVGRYTLVGTKGSLVADPGYEWAEGIKHETRIGEKTIKREFPKRDQFAAEIEYFSECILQNKEPEPSGEEGLADVRIIEAIYESAESGKTVKLPKSSKTRRPTTSQEIRRKAHAMPETVNVESPSGEDA